MQKAQISLIAFRGTWRNLQDQESTRQQVEDVNDAEMINHYIIASAHVSCLTSHVSCLFFCFVSTFF